MPIQHACRMACTVPPRPCRKRAQDSCGFLPCHLQQRGVVTTQTYNVRISRAWCWLMTRCARSWGCKFIHKCSCMCGCSAAALHVARVHVSGCHASFGSCTTGPPLNGGRLRQRLCVGGKITTATATVANTTLQCCCCCCCCCCWVLLVLPCLQCHAGWAGHPQGQLCPGPHKLSCHLSSRTPSARVAVKQSWAPVQ
jgi:hypothetical protein